MAILKIAKLGHPVLVKKTNEINNLKKQALDEVEEAFKFAETQPWPKPEDSLNDVYVNYPKNLIL